VTQISFNEDNDNQSVLFTPTKYINKAQYAVTSKVANTPEVLKMVVMTPYQADMSGKPAKLEAPKPLGKMFEEDEAKAMAKTKAESAIDEPIKRPAKTAPAPVTKKDLDSVVKAWSDEE